MRGTPEERFWAKVQKSEGCWEWTATRGRRGYGYFRHEGKNKLAHRWSYENCVGPIPDGLVIDHLCMNTGCVKPGHLEAVTREVNDFRRRNNRTHCPQMHEYDERNSMFDARGYRLCRVCRNAVDRAGKRRRREQARDRNRKE